MMAMMAIHQASAVLGLEMASVGLALALEPDVPEEPEEPVVPAEPPELFGSLLLTVPAPPVTPAFSAPPVPPASSPELPVAASPVPVPAVPLAAGVVEVVEVVVVVACNSSALLFSAAA